MTPLNERNEPVIEGMDKMAFPYRRAVSAHSTLPFTHC